MSNLFNRSVGLNLENIAVGLVVRNYPAMCKLLGEKVKAGKGKELQLNEWRKHFEWKNEGHKFIITNIREITSYKKIYKTDLYTDDVLSIIVWNLKNGSSFFEEEKYYTTNNLLCLCGFVNMNYAEKMDTLSIFSEENGCSYQQAKYLYNQLYKHIKGYSKNALLRCLTRLHDRKIIKFKTVYLIKYLNDKKGRLATYEEEKKYLELCDSAKKRLGITQLDYYNESKFYKEVNEELAKLGIMFCYKVYHIELAVNGNAENIELSDVTLARCNINAEITKRMIAYIDADIKKKITKQLISEGLDEEYTDIVEITSAFDERKEKLQREIELKEALVEFYIKLKDNTTEIEEIISNEEMDNLVDSLLESNNLS